MAKTDDPYWITVVEHTGFSEVADQVFADDDRDLLTEFIAMHPTAGEEIPETGGLRWTEWGERHVVVYYFRDVNVPAYLLAIYRKGEVMNLSNDEKRIMRILVNELGEIFGLAGALKVASSSDGAA